MKGHGGGHGGNQGGGAAAVEGGSVIVGGNGALSMHLSMCYDWLYLPGGH